MKLYCIALTPIRRPAEKLPPSEREYEIAAAKEGKVLTPMHRMMIKFSEASTIMGDSRTETFHTVRQRLAVFTDKSKAAKAARAATNEIWRASVRECRLIE
jgi:hypothetical protein